MEMTKILTFLIISIFLFPAYSFSKEKDEIEELRREITILNLINGLNLTDHQAKEILKYAEEAKTIRDSVKEDYSLMETELKTALTELRDNLNDKNLRPPGELERHVTELNHRAKEKKKEFMRQLKEIEKKVESVLTPGQLEIVKGFKPCLIPPKDLKNPARAGQAFDSSPAERLLERARRIPEGRYSIIKHRIADEYIKRIESHTQEVTESEREAKTALLLETLDKARMMTDEEFALNKKELVLNIIPEKDELKRKDIGRIERFLLDEKIINILEKRLNASQRQGPTGNIGLLSIGERYEGRSCALKTL